MNNNTINRIDIMKIEKKRNWIFTLIVIFGVLVIVFLVNSRRQTNRENRQIQFVTWERADLKVGILADKMKTLEGLESDLEFKTRVLQGL